jgi:mRNA interferase MazF
MFADPKRGEIWMVEFTPQVGAELRDPHPAIVISMRGAGALPLRIVVPVRSAQNSISLAHPWMVQLHPTPANGLTKICRADTSQVKSAALERFRRRMGILENDKMMEVLEAVALCIGL